MSSVYNYEKAWAFKAWRYFILNLGLALKIVNLSKMNPNCVVFSIFLEKKSRRAIIEHDSTCWVTRQVYFLVPIGSTCWSYLRIGVGSRFIFLYSLEPEVGSPILRGLSRKPWLMSSQREPALLQPISFILTRHTFWYI